MLQELTTRHLRYHATARPLAAMEVDYPSGTSTGLHAHPRGQLLYAIEGVMVVRSAEGAWVVPSNRALWLVAGLAHEVWMCGEVKIRTLFVDPDVAPHLPARSGVLAVSPLLRELFVAAVAVPTDYSLGSRDERLLQLLLDEVRPLNVPSMDLPLPGDPRVRTVCETLSRQPGDARTAAQWADELGITSRTLHRLFAREVGMRFAQWRQQARLLFALQRLARGDKVIDVALDSGYASQSAFAVMFRKHFGVPPSVFYR